MKHWEPIPVTVRGDEPPKPSTITLQVWEDDLPYDPDHSCYRSRCKPPGEPED